MPLHHGDMATAAATVTQSQPIPPTPIPIPTLTLSPAPGYGPAAASPFYYTLFLSPNSSHHDVLLRHSNDPSLSIAAVPHNDQSMNGSPGASWRDSWQRVGSSSRIVHPHWLSYAPLPYSMHVCVGLLLTLTALSSLVGNGLVLWSIFRFRSLRTSSNLFIISLAVADILMSSVDLPLFAAASFLGYWPFGYHVCQIYGATTGTAGLVTINTLAAISYDRYTVVVRRVGPMHHISKHTTLLVIAVTWLVSVLWVTAPLLGWSHFILEGIGTSCSFDYLTRGPKNGSYVIVLMVCNFGLPLMLIVYSYVRIFISVCSVQRGLMDFTPQIAVGTQRQRSRRRTEVKVAFTMLAIICFFCLAWTPYVIVAVIGLFGDVSLVTPTVSAIPCIFAKVATVSNPPLYSIGHPKFRKKIRYLVKSSFQRVPTITSSPQTTDNQEVIHLSRTAC